MSHLFISYATDDRAIAEEVCALLEANGVTCWIAPRDVAAGKVWDEAILDAIEAAPAFLLILSSHSNASVFVKNEVNRAFSQGKAIITFRTEDVMPGRSLELYLARHHWTDGFAGRIEDQVAQLAASIVSLVGAPGPGASGVAVAAPAAAKTGRKAHLVTRATRRERIAWTVAGVLGVALLLAASLAAAFALGAFSRRPLDTAGPVYRTSILPAPDTALATVTVSFRFALSPDGQMLAFVATGEGGQQIWLRRLDTETASPLPGTENGVAPFWSPDSRTVGFFDPVQRKLKRVDVAGGTAQAICDLPSRLGAAGTAGASWNASGVIVFGPNNEGLFRVPASGGTPAVVASTDTKVGELTLAMPWFLPDGTHFLFMVRTASDATTYVGSLDGGARTMLLRSAAGVKYTRGHLVYTRDRTLLAHPFDASRLALTGEPVPLAENVATGGTSGRQAAFAVSTSGALVYQAGNASASRMTWLDRSGKEVGTIAGLPPTVVNPALSRDGRHLAVSSNASGDVWIADLTRTAVSRFTFGPARDRDPIWSPDGQRVVFYSNRGGTFGLYEKSASGGEERLLVSSATTRSPKDWSADGRFILYDAADSSTGTDVWVLDLAGERKATPLFHGSFQESDAWFSPDGRWIAYQSNESGRFEVYVQPFPLSDAKWQISTAGGSVPQWRQDGKELFYRADNRLMSVPVQSSPTFTPGTPAPLFQVPIPNSAGNARFAVFPDGQRFLFNMPAADISAREITLLTNWPALVKKP